MMYETGGKIYDVCGTCGEIIRINKPIVGSLHLCALDEEVRNPGIAAALRGKYDINRRAIDALAAQKGKSDES